MAAGRVNRVGGHGGGVAALEVCDWQGLERRPVGGDGLGGGRGRAAATPWSLVVVLQLGEFLCGGWWGAHSLGGSCCRRCWVKRIWGL